VYRVSRVESNVVWVNVGVRIAYHDRCSDVYAIGYVAFHQAHGLARDEPIVHQKDAAPHELLDVTKVVGDDRHVFASSDVPDEDGVEE
jgi:hypothetical protein